MNGLLVKKIQRFNLAGNACGDDGKYVSPLIVKAMTTCDCASRDFFVISVVFKLGLGVS